MVRAAFAGFLLFASLTACGVPRIPGITPYQPEIQQGNYVSQEMLSQVKQGMTREQVTMAVGWPIASENPRLEADVWRYWIDSWSEYQVSFDKVGMVKAVTATPAVPDRVLYVPAQ